VRKLRSSGYNNLLLLSRENLDLSLQEHTRSFFTDNRPEYVFLSAAMVGGIYANDTCPADFIYSNIQIQTNIIHYSYQAGVKKLVFLGSSCVYPKFARQPIVESALLSGLLEPTNEAYAVAKISGIMMCHAYNRQYRTNYVAVMPTNLYGINDHYDLKKSHVLPALIRKFHEAKINGVLSVTLWGTGNALREFLYVDDLADACILVMNGYNANYDETRTPIDKCIINIGSGEEISIKNLALIVKEVVGYEGEIRFDPRMPDGTPRKIIDSSRMRFLGWKPTTRLVEGIAMAYEDFKYLSRHFKWDDD
jgi:GDP-L-fucose synthase